MHACVHAGMPMPLSVHAGVPVGMHAPLPPGGYANGYENGAPAGAAPPDPMRCHARRLGRAFCRLTSVSPCACMRRCRPAATRATVWLLNAAAV